MNTMIDYSKKENWTKSLLAFTLENHCVLSDEERNSFDRLWVTKLDCEKVLGAVIKPAEDNLVSEKYEDESRYVEVDHNFANPPEGKGAKDAVSILAGTIHANNEKDIYYCINVSTDEARRFAQAILNVCDEIDSE